MGDLIAEFLGCLDRMASDATLDDCDAYIEAGDLRERLRELIDSQDRAVDRLASLEETLRRYAFKLVQASDDGGDFRNLDTSETLHRIGEELHAIRKDHTASPFVDGKPGALDRLARALYGRDPRPQDYLGGSDARIFDDAAEALGAKDDGGERLAQLVAALNRLASGWRVDANDVVRERDARISQTSTGWRSQTLNDCADALRDLLAGKYTTQSERLADDDAKKAELWGMLVSMIGHGETLAALTDHELAAKLEGGLADLPIHSRRYALIESLLARLERADGDVCEPLDGESDPEYRKARVCRDCEHWRGEGHDKHCALFTVGKVPSECPAWKRKRATPLEFVKRVPGEYGGDVLVRRQACAWPKCEAAATHVQPMCGGPGSFVDVPLCAEHFEAMKLNPHADISISATTTRDDEPTVPGGTPLPKKGGES